MTKGQTKTLLTNTVDAFLIGLADTSTLNQSDLNALTDKLAKCLEDTVNPNGPGYPSTPR